MAADNRKGDYSSAEGAALGCLGVSALLGGLAVVVVFLIPMLFFLATCVGACAGAV